MERDGIDFAITAKDFKTHQTEPTWSGVRSFFRRRYSKDLTGADVAVLGVPFDTATTNRPGTRFGPAGIRDASCMIAWGLPWPWGFNPVEKLAVVDYGDVLFDFGHPDRVPAAIAEQAQEIVAQGVTLLSLGGDHFVTYPLLQAVHAVHGPVALVHFDAHSDTWIAADENEINHGVMFYQAMRKGWVVPEHSVQIGLRTHNDSTHGFNILDAAWVHRHGPDAVIAEVKRIVGDRKAYLTFDIDCLDPAFAPGTGTPVTGGLSSYQALAILRGLTGMNFVAMDVVEVSPPYDHAGITSLAGATLALEFLAILALQKGVATKGERNPYPAAAV
jgi:agmatinase